MINPNAHSGSRSASSNGRSNADLSDSPGSPEPASVLFIVCPPIVMVVRVSCVIPRRDHLLLAGSSHMYHSESAATRALLGMVLLQRLTLIGAPPPHSAMGIAYLRKES